MKKTEVESASELRVYNHNNWPAIDLFPGEREFRNRLARHNIQQIFLTAELVPNEKDESFNAYVGHILDGLDSLPYRPDICFDYMFRIIDQGFESFASENSPHAKSLTEKFFDKNPNMWGKVTETLCSHLPQQTADYIASRILDCWLTPDNKSEDQHAEFIKRRASRTLGKDRYAEIRKKFFVLDSANPAIIIDFPYQNRRNAGRFIRLLLQLSTPLSRTKEKTSDNISLTDLSLETNLLSSKEKVEALIELALQTYRNERFHGDSFSPFRSSKATLKTYAHAYFLLIVTYVMALGIMELNQQGEITLDEIDRVTTKAMEQFVSFFGSSLDE